MRFLLPLFLFSQLLCEWIPCSKKTLHGLNTTRGLSSGTSWINFDKELFKQDFANTHASYLQPAMSLLLPNSNTQALFKMNLLQNSRINYKTASLSFIQSYWINPSSICSPLLGLQLSWLSNHNIQLQNLGPQFGLDFEYFFSNHFSLSCPSYYCPYRSRQLYQNTRSYTLSHSFNSSILLNFSNFFNDFSSFFQSSFGYKFSQSSYATINSLIFTLNYSL